ncbi:MAG: hypothetical protein Q4C91_00800 [Eubacteriales bacterium]|nr:hypothetical protein [Eubacteriales bacterium]
MCEAMKTLMQEEMMEAQRIGEARGEMKAKRETALKMKKKGYPDTTIADLLEVGLNIVQRWISEKPSVAR